jgi:DNA-binding response OmpR family regulator
MGKKRILVVDDEKDLIEVLTLRLEANGYEVVSAYDGQDGLDKAKREKPDLIILDLMLPNSRYNKIPIILFTARAQEADKKLGEELGGDAYINKPFEPQTLLAKIKELLKE